MLFCFAFAVIVVSITTYWTFIKYLNTLIYLNCLYGILIKKFIDFNVLLSIVNSILPLGSSNDLLDLDDFMHYR